MRYPMTLRLGRNSGLDVGPHKDFLKAFFGTSWVQITLGRPSFEALDIVIESRDVPTAQQSKGTFRDHLVGCVGDILWLNTRQWLRIASAQRGEIEFGDDDPGQ